MGVLCKFGRISRQQALALNAGYKTTNNKWIENYILKCILWARVGMKCEFLDQNDHLFICKNA